MDVAKLLAELKAYKTQLDQAIGALERLSSGRGAAKNKRAMSDTTKKKMAQAQRKRWAKARKGHSDKSHNEKT